VLIHEKMLSITSESEANKTGGKRKEHEEEKD
jgi:hypothetical protein